MSASLVVGLLVVCSLGGCRKDKADAAAKPQPALNADSAKKSIEELNAPVDALNTKFKYLHSKFDPLPQDLPGFGDVRAKFYATDEVVGRMAAKMAWLSERADAAAKSGNREELEQVSKDVAQTHTELRQLDQISTELIHQVVPFERMVKEMRANEAAGGALFLRVLPGGYEISAGGNGVEQALLEFLENPARKVEPTTWFDFDKLTFAGADVDAGRSKAQLTNVAEILKAYPSVNLVIGVYTDKNGVLAANQKLSAARAQSVKKELVALGVAEGRLRVVDSDAKPLLCTAKDKDECVAMSRRAALRVTAK